MSRLLQSMQPLLSRIARVRAWKDGSTNRAVASALLVVGIVHVGVVAVAVVKEVLIARSVGVSDAWDAFLIAYLLPSFAIVVLAGSFAPAVVPTYIRVRDIGSTEESQRLLGSTIIVAAVLLLLVATLLGLLFPIVLPLLAAGFPPEKLALSRSLFYRVLPVVVLSGLGSILAAILNASKRFVFATAIPASTHLAVVVGILLFPRAGAQTIATSIVIGSGVELLGFWFAVRRHGIRFAGLHFPDSLREIGRQYGAVVLSAALMSGTNLVDLSMSAALGGGSVAALTYASKIPNAILTVASTAAGAAIMPFISTMLASGDSLGALQTMRRMTKGILLAAVPVTGILVLFAEPVVRLAFERGAFSPTDTVLVSSIQRLFALQIPFYIATIPVVRTIAALRASEILAWTALLNLVLNTVLNYTLMQLIGVRGIALSTALVYLISFLVTYRAATKRLAAMRVP